MDSVDAPAPSAGVPQHSQPSAASAVTHRVEDIITERWASSSTISVTYPAPQVDALAASTDPASPTPAPHPATTSNGASEDIMEHDHNEASGWDTVHYRRYTTRRLKGELRSERVSRPHFFVLVRPLNQTSIDDIPKSAITRLIGQTAPSSVAAEHAAFKYIAKANAVRLSIWDKQHLCNLLAQTELTLTLGSPVEGRRIPVEIVDATHPAEVTSKGVVKIRAEHTEEYIANHIRCESANILDFRIMGKTQMLLITFDTPRPPRRLSLDYEIVPVYEHRPRALACYRCHGLGHMAKFCPSQAVCRHCGRSHEEHSQCEETPFCVACQAAGHISLDPNCPTRAYKATRVPPPKQSPPAESHHQEQKTKIVKNSSTAPKTWTQVAASTTATGSSKVEERLERLEQAHAVSAGAWSKLQQQMEHFLQQKLDAMQEQITHWIQASQGARDQATVDSRPPERPKEFIEPSLPKGSSLTSSQAPLHPNTATQLCSTTQSAVQGNSSVSESKSPAHTEQVLDTIMQLLEKMNSRMEAIERTMEQQEQIINQHKEANENEIAHFKTMVDECKRNYRRARNRSRE
ncbi:hypothetical protein HPB50_018207 [Hyalomma asiaticum]|uniref:Uncharacterized protein n=1 Tax=Hyalomma asiaticum TaxID=266040 RepID=A0ACB7TMR8_HYAAI|nr:hypothetical protein HPB50_018207 [Hyalomma asiaticum]